jgi:adenosylcobinamide amidohydrolase
VAGAVGLLTARRLDRYVSASRSAGGVSAEVVATVGLGNHVRVGDPAGSGAEVAGTINVLCRLSVPLTTAGALEALSIAAEARTVAVREAAIPSRHRELIDGQPRYRPFAGRFASGTGTDCLVLATPLGGPTAGYAGKHTALGEVIGAAVLEAVSRGLEEALADQRRAPEWQ